MIRCYVVLTCALSCFFGAQVNLLQAQGWRGPTRDGVVQGFDRPNGWPETLTQKWTLEVGTGHSTPIVADEKIYQFSRQEDRETLCCLDLAGKEVWKQSYDAPYKMNNAARGHGKGPKSTPWVGEDRIFTLGIDGIFQCRSRADGKLLWQAGDDLPTGSPLYGAATSPLGASGNVCLIHLGKHKQGALVAFEAATGKVRGRWDGDGPAYASPVFMDFDDRRQLVIQSQNFCLSLAVDGTVLWKIPFTTGYDQNSVTPLQYKDTVIFSGYQKGVTGVRPKKDAAGKWTTDEVWHTDEVSMYMSSPVLLGDRLFGFSEKRKGQLFCLDAATGKSLWLGPPRQSDNAALLVVGDTIAALLTDGRLLFISGKSDDYQPLAEFQVADTPTWAHPALFGKNILVKDETDLTLWSLEE